MGWDRHRVFGSGKKFKNSLTGSVFKEQDRSGHVTTLELVK